MFALEKFLKLLMNAIKFSQVGPTGNSKFTKTSLRLLEQDLKASTTKMVLFKIKKSKLLLDLTFKQLKEPCNSLILTLTVAI